MQERCSATTYDRRQDLYLGGAVLIPIEHRCELGVAHDGDHFTVTMRGPFSWPNQAAGIWDDLVEPSPVVPVPSPSRPETLLSSGDVNRRHPSDPDPTNR